MIFVAAASNFLIYRYTIDLQFAQLRDKLMAIAQVAALRIDVPTLQAIPLARESSRLYEYKNIAGRLSEIKRAIPSVRYLYIMTRTNNFGILQFVVDADSGSPTEGVPSYPGDLYDPKEFPEMLKAFDGPTADRKLGTDEWGAFLSGYSPIFDSGGRAVAILGVDMTAQDVYRAQKEVLWRAVFVFALGIFLAISLGTLISGGVTGRIAELMTGADRVAHGDLEYKVRVRGSDEIARLGLLFNNMSSDLKQHIDKLRRATAEKERLLKELEIAKGIQESFLPESAPHIEGADIAALSVPARVVGGDFYDFIPLDAGKWGLVIADVSGKGIPAAIFMALSRSLIRASIAGYDSPADALSNANNLILQDSKSSMFVTLFYAVLDPVTMTLTFANAGHNPPFLLSGPSDGVVFLKAQGVPLGISSDVKMDNESIILKGGDIVVLYTDGVTEAVSGSGERFEIDRLKDIVTASRNISAKEILDRVMKELSVFAGTRPQFDDITMMVVKADRI
jgi:serine phosphatase RsbU (regulator of sigma subunit)